MWVQDDYSIGDDGLHQHEVVMYVAIPQKG